jgi:hypothetical protein
MRLDRWAEGEWRTVEQRDVPPDKETHEVVLTARSNGLHRVVWRERKTGTQIEWPEDLKRTIESSPDQANGVWGRQSWYFYVPEGTEVIGGYARARAGGVFDPDGQAVLNFKKAPNDYVSLPVPEGQDGRLWSVRRMAGSFRLMTVPPFGARSAEDLLLPLEVVGETR